MAGIFISYRREDSSGQAGRLYDRLRERFGAHDVFRDINTIEFGENFADAVRERVGAASVCLVVIGRQWLTIKDGQGRPRLENPRDMVLLESAIALEKKIPLIPVLVDGAAMPKPEELPKRIQGLAWRNALSLSEDTFDYEFGLLAGRIEKILDGKAQPWRRPAAKWAAAGMLAAAAAAGAFFAARNRESASTAAAIGSVSGLAAGGDYRGAWNLLHERDPGGKVRALRAARENLAMLWLRNIRSGDEQGFTRIVQDLQPVLVRGMEESRGAHQADLAAHLGWAWFLRWREGARDVDPAVYYNRALEIDPANPYGNAMLGHWLLWTDGEQKLEEARLRFTRAVSAGRDRAAVRQLQLAALRNLNRVAAWQEYVRALNDMRKNSEPIRKGEALPLTGEWWFTLRDEKRRKAYLAALPLDEHAETIRAVSAALPDLPDYKRDLSRVWLALVEEQAGQKDRALRDFRAVQERQPGDQAVAAAAEAGVKRLGP